MEGVMRHDSFALTDIAQRIAATENRVEQLRQRVERLEQEGSDATRDQHVLKALSGNLAQLYRRQSSLRQSRWAFSQ
jgi:predicted  nucleic acid-binding Zn-ribbon protein